jgi:hypothetical protein
MELTPLAYHFRIVDYLRAREAAVWDWYGGQKAKEQQTATLRLELLKSTIRLDRATHGVLYASAERVAKSLALDVDTTFYQAIGYAGATNASLFWLAEGAHIVFCGDVEGALSGIELEAVIAHELGHLRLWREEDGAFYRALRILSDMSGHPRAAPNVERSEVRFRQCAEIYADRAALVATGNIEAVISSLVKIETGLGHVDPHAYQEQAAEIFGIERPQTQGLDHPETYIRVFVLTEWARGSDAGASAIERTMAGPLQIDRLDLLEQMELEDFTRKLLLAFFAPAWTRSLALLAHARLFFAGFLPTGEPPSLDQLAAHVKDVDASVLDFLAYVLLDFAAADPSLHDLPLVQAMTIADAFGIRARVEDKASKELKVTKKVLALLRAEGRSLLDQAATAPSETR